MESGGTTTATEAYQYVGPFRLEKTLGKGQTGKSHKFLLFHCLKYKRYFLPMQVANNKAQYPRGIRDKSYLS